MSSMRRLEVIWFFLVDGLPKGLADDSLTIELTEFFMVDCKGKKTYHTV